MFFIELIFFNGEFTIYAYITDVLSLGFGVE